MIHHTIYRPNAISIKLPMAYIPELEQNMVTICMQTHKIGKATLRKKKGKNREKKKKKKKAGGFNLPDFKVYYKAMVIKTV